MGVLCWSLRWYAYLCVFSSVCNHLNEEEMADCFAFLPFLCLVTINVVWFFLTVPWVGLECVIVVFPDHTYFPSV